MRIYYWYPALASLAIGFSFMNIPPVSGQFMEQLDLGHDELSWFLSGLFWSHALMQLPAGLLADRLSPWRIMVAGIGLCMVANLLPFVAPQNMAWATGMRVVLGVGTSCGFMGLMKVMFILVPGEKLARVQGFQGAAFGAGFVLPYLILPQLENEAWVWSYLIAAALLVVALGLAFTLPQNCLGPIAKSRSNSEVWAAIKSIATSKIIWVLGIFHGLSYGSLNNLGSWLPQILADLDEQGDPLAWTSATALILGIGVFGRILGRNIMPWFSLNRAVNGAILIICLLYLVMGLSGQKYMVFGAAILMALACGSTYGGVFSLSAATKVAFAATAMGLMNMIANLINAFIILSFGYIRHYTDNFSPGLLALGLLGLGLWFWGHKTISQSPGSSQ